MGFGIIIWTLTLILTYLVTGKVLQRHTGLSKRVLLLLFFYHSLLAIVYYAYALSNPSDSKAYFNKASVKIHGENWADYYGISTAFIDFLSFFLVNRMGLNYEGCMALFAWLGYLGFVFFYIFLKENFRHIPKISGFNGLLFLLFLPNLHFWSSSLGKGAVIFLGFALFFFGLNKPGARWLALLVGGWIIFHVRPHIFYVTLIGLALGFTFSAAKVNWGYRILVVGLSVFLLNIIYADVLALTGLEDDSMLDPYISHRAAELTKATSGIDITNYSVVEKLFAFWFRPLFFDAPGVFGIIVSFENLFYLLFFARLLKPKAWVFLFKSDAIVKTAALTFLGVSFALAQITGNLGLAMRQKSQVMLLGLFVVLKFMESQRLALRQTEQRRKALQNSKKQQVTPA